MCACPGIMLITEYVFPYLHHAGGFALSLIHIGAQKMFFVLQKKKKILCIFPHSCALLAEYKRCTLAGDYLQGLQCIWKIKQRQILMV